MTFMKLGLLIALLCSLLLCPRASGWYDPGTQRWLNRDPLGEPGAEVAHNGKAQVTLVGRRDYSPKLELANAYWFVKNDTMGLVDVDGRECLGYNSGGGIQNPFQSHHSPPNYSYTREVIDNFKLSNQALPGLLAPTGAGLLTAGRTAAATDGITLGRWAFGGFRGYSVGAATFTGAEAGIIAGGVAVLNFTLVGLAWEGGLLAGSALGPLYFDYHSCENQY
jgi:hypothetical protein